MQIWKDVPGFEGYYEVNTEGDVRRTGKQKLLSKVIDRDGYIAYCFCVKGKRTNVVAHRVVMETFVGPCPLGHVTRHKDGVRANNHLTNLEYGTPAENAADMLRHNTQAKGEQVHLSKLTEADVINIRNSSLSQVELARLYNVTSGNISLIISRITWKHI